jgi:hypothetical protein
MIGEVSRESTVEVGRVCLEVSCEAAILQREVIVLLLVHFLIDDILLSDTEGPASPSLVNLRSATG